MIKVGLTGGIGSGKSTVSNFIKEIGIPVIDADIISREVLNIYKEILILIEEAFGKDVINDDGTLNRKKLGSIVFSDIKKKYKLEEIIIPFIKKEIFKEIEEYHKAGEKMCVLDAPTLIENNLHKDMDYNILVWVDRETQIKRVIERDKLSEVEVLSRIQAQMSSEEKKKCVDFVIDNSGSLEKTLITTKEVLENINER